MREPNLMDIVRAYVCACTSVEDATMTAAHGVRQLAHMPGINPSSLLKLRLFASLVSGGILRLANRNFKKFIYSALRLVNYSPDAAASSPHTELPRIFY